MELRYFMRKPIFPMVGKIEGHFIGAKTPGDLSKKLTKIQLNKDESYTMVDFTGEAWGLYLYPAEMVLTPLVFKKRWTKLEIIKSFNERENNELGEGRKYSEKSLSAKRLGKIISDLVEISSGSKDKTTNRK